MNEPVTFGDIVAKLEKKSDITPELIADSIKKMVEEANEPEMIERRNLQLKRLKQGLDQYFAYIFPVNPSEPVIAVPIQEEDPDWNSCMYHMDD